MKTNLPSLGPVLRIFSAAATAAGCCQRGLTQGLAALLSFFLITTQLSAAPKATEIRIDRCNTLICPADYTIFACGDVAFPQSYDVQLVNDCPGIPPLKLVCKPAPGTPLPVGTSTIVCGVFGPNGQELAKCSFDITVVQDTEPPKLECPQDITVLACPTATGLCGAFVNYPAPVASDNSGAVSVVCNPPSGSFFTCGVHVVTCVAIDRCENKSACRFTVIVKEGGKPPVIKCPENVLLTTCSNSAVAAYPPILVDPPGTVVTCNPPPGTVLPLGVHVVICTASNACGETKCSFDVVVRPLPKVEITCPDSLLVTLPCSSNCVPVYYPLPVVANGALALCDPPSGTCLPPGNHVVTCLATNECGGARCEFVIKVIKGTGEPVTIQCPKDLVVRTCGDCAKVTYPKPVVLNGDIASCEPPSGYCFPIGVTPVRCIATNACGRTECEFIVTVESVPRLEIKCPTNIVVTTCGQGEVVNYPAPTVIGAGAVDPAEYQVICDPPSGSVFPVGTNRVVCCVIDRCQRKSCCEFDVIVIAGQKCVKPPVNMVLWLPFDELAGVVTANIVPGAPNGFKISGPVSVPGQKVINSLAFDGLNDFVAVPNYGAILLNQSDFSIDAWILRREESGRRVIVSKVSPVPGAAGPIPHGYEFFLNQGVMQLSLGGAILRTFNSGVVVPVDNRWHHVAVTVGRSGNGKVTFYLDGASAAALPGPIPAPLGNNSRLYVGASTFLGPKDFFRGMIDEVEIFNRELAAAEVGALWQADTSGKCKIRCRVPWDVSFPPNSPYVNVTATVCNDSGIAQPISFDANGPMTIVPATGSFVLPPNTCTSMVFQISRPTNNLPVGSVVRWTLDLHPGRACPVECMGSVINPGPLVITVASDVLEIPGTRRGALQRVSIEGLAPGTAMRLRAIGPDMEPDLDTLSLNGLPPGQPWIRKTSSPAPAAGGDSFDVPVKFEKADPIGEYTILIEADVDGDGTFDTLRSFDVSNPVVTPPTLQVTKATKGVSFDWADEGDGVLEAAESLDGPWVVIDGARPGYVMGSTGKLAFFRVVIPADN